MPAIGDQAPNFSADTLNDMGRFDLAEYEGQVVIIVFAGITWCSPCRTEARYLQRLADEFSRRGSQFVIISVNDTFTGGEPAPRLQAELRSFGLTMPVIPVSDELLADYEVSAIPYNFILARDHRICSIHRGASPEDELRRDIADCLRRPYIPPEHRAGCAMAIRQFIRALGNARPSMAGSMRLHSDFTPMPEDRDE
jgi:thiol-disulfide isomerase/thioredoxin